MIEKVAFIFVMVASGIVFIESIAAIVYAIDAAMMFAMVSSLILAGSSCMCFLYAYYLYNTYVKNR